jgi:hypothetical protein
MYQLYNYYKNERIKQDGNVAPDITMIKDHDGICLFLWQSLLYTVLEFLKHKNAIPNYLDADVNKIYNQLREFRNCVFHIQDNYMDPRQNALWEKQDSISISRRVHIELGKFLCSELESSP